MNPKDQSVCKVEELFGVDLRALALFRMAIALLIIIDLFLRLSDLKVFYTDDGVLPRVLYIEQFGNWFLSLHILSGSWIFQAVLFLVNIIFAITLLLGFCTRLATFMCWLLIVSLYTRNILIVNGGDVLLGLMLFWSMFLPLGAKYSIDGLLDSSDQKLPNYILSFGTIGILFQVVFMYIFTVILKIGPEWLEGSAIYYSLSADQFVLPLGLILLGFPQVLKLLTHLVFLFEFIGPLLLFTPIFTGMIRTIVSFAFILLHLGFALTLNVGIFPFISSIVMILFLPGWFWDKFNFKNNLACSFKNSISKLQGNSIFGKFLINRKLNIKISLFENILAVFFILYIFAWNLASVERLNFHLPSSLSWAGYAFQICQRWNMFEPKLIKFDGWYVIPGKLQDGKYVDLFNNESKINWDKPKSVLSTFKNNRWRSYLRNIFVDINKEHPPYYANYLCNKWNSKHQGSRKLKELSVYIVREDTLPDYKVSKSYGQLLYSYKCN